MRRVVITGMGGICPIGNNVAEIWESILNNKCGIDYIRNNDLQDLPVKILAEVKDFKFEDFLSKKDIKQYSKFINFARIASNEAYRDSGLDENMIDHSKFGVFISSSVGGSEKIDESYESNFVNPYYIPSTMINSASSIVAMDLKANGQNMCISSACASGNNSIGEAYLKIKYDMQDVMLAGSSEFTINKKILQGFAAMRAVYLGNEVDRACIPFDKDRQGFVMGEGAGILVLEELEHAMNRKAKIYAEVVGYGATCDAYHITSPSLDGTYAAEAIRLALKDANITPKEIDYINAHGTGTVVNDMVETKVIKNVFKEFYKKPYVSSTKSSTGHLVAASGAIEGVICSKALEQGYIPATINTKNIDEQCDLNIVREQGIRKEINYVLSNSFGFGGDNACLIFKKWKI